MKENVILKQESFQGTSIIFASKLMESDIKEFFENAYKVEVTSVKRQKVNSDKLVVFKIEGFYLHGGFNNICFESTFYSNDLGYKTSALVERLKVNRHDLWSNFMIQKFGKEYANQYLK